MKEILISVRCLHCGHVSYVKSEQLISATLEPEIREAILKNTYFQGICSCCGQPYAYFIRFCMSIRHMIL
ncbi:CpXC domain-containing protein [Massilicoli timonensis]|uniref:CpXC domain-containing protein n=1 Tax=Massilicoli timonensis TaxID=2015901 RepID=UPI0023EF9552|nr:CpXC domain-containing protein [Massilicoli timonensis]